ncbi:general secretion pathway protein D [Candidatus Photodesmus blepharus]|uniref:General secretion pathway protein D n=1 Tax=Candidatus Photodesmus blepharonis TaxID=1179155 RepID=A0A084CNJ6_9GAMM|nr:type II secretion system secretin GspD [Candidatus Photodesmus blepharus]KEY91375.1 general secretion pathway protein D [Candidatus Photodesmus blepharus]
MTYWLKRISWLCSGSLLVVSLVAANDFSANFKGADIQEFINIVGRNLKKTLIIDPSVRGKIDIRSYDVLTEEQYYSFFLNVLEVYGFSVVEMESGILKVIKSKDAKTSAIPVVSDGNIDGDNVVTRVVAVHNVSVRELSPLLRQLNDNAGSGNVVHYDPANIILITGSAAVVNRLAEIVKRVDQAGDKKIEVVELKNASSTEMVRIVKALNKNTSTSNIPIFLQPKLVADDRTNSVLISGDPEVRVRLKNLMRQLDLEMAPKGSNRVVYLKYARAEDLVSVLEGLSNKLQAEKSAPKENSNARRSEVMIAAHPETNALVLTAPPDVMNTIQGVISQLDIRRAQVLIEALIVEIAESDGVNLGVQWGSLASGALIQYRNSNTPIGQVMLGLEDIKDKTITERYWDSSSSSWKTRELTERGDYSGLAKVFSRLNGAALSIATGDWTALIHAVASDSDSNILSSPSITVMDNGEASFIVGEEVPVITGSTVGLNNGNPFQTVDRKEVGIKLRVIPQINEGNSIHLNIEQEVSNVLGANGAIDVRFSKRQLHTSVMVEDGQMIVLGGLINEHVLESQSKVPLFGDIPILGYLFKSTSTQIEKKNLMVFIKPTIIRDGIMADSITQRKYNFIRAEQLYKMDEGLRLMNDINIPVIPKFGEVIGHYAEFEILLKQMEEIE